MQQNQSQLYLNKIKLPTDIIANIKLSQLLDELNACCTTINKSQITPENSTPKDQVKSVQLIVKKMGSFLQGQDLKIEQLNNFAILLSTEQKNSSKFTGNFIGLMNKLSMLIIPNLIKHLPITNQLIKNLIYGVYKQQQLLKGEITYKLFIALFQYQSLYILKQSLPQIVQYFGQFIPYFVLIQKQIKGDKQQLFHVLRVLIKYYSIVLVLIEQRMVPNNFYLYLKGSEVQFVENYCNYVIDQSHEEMFFNTLEKYILVDPQYRSILLNTIHKIYQFNFKSSRIMKFYKVAINLMNKQIFSDHNYDQDIFSLLFQIKVSLQRENIQNYNQMVIMLINQKSVQFFMNYKTQFIKIASISQQIQKILFPFYYEITFTNKELVDPQILNAVIQWNLNLQLIPTQKFIKELIALGINKLTVQTQGMIFTKQSPNWSSLKQKIIQKKCQQYLQSQQTKTPQTFQTYCYFKQTPQIYRIYFKMFTQLIINSQSQKFNKNLESSFTLQVNLLYNQQNIDTIKKINKYFLNILQKAAIYQIKGFYLLKDISLIHSLLEIIQPINLDNKKLVKFYIQNIQNLTTKQINQLIQFLLRIFAVFKNYFTLYLIICCGLHIYSRQKNQQNLQQPFIKVIQYIVNIQNQSSYAKITSYHSQNLLAIILLINITKSEQLIQKCQQLITNWSSLFNSYDLDLILYQFDKKNYIQYLKTFQIKYQPVCHIQKAIFLTLTQISQLLRQSNIKSCNYVSRAHNSINFIPIIYQNHKNNIYLSFKALLNSKMCCYSYVQIHGSSRENPSNVQKHRIVFKNKQIIFYNRSTKQVICSLQLQQQHYSRPFAVTISIANSKIKIQINKTQLIGKQYNLLVQNIKFQQQGDLMMKQLKWKRFGEEEKDLSFKQYLQIYPNEFQIKINKTHQHEINNVSQKFNILYIVTYLQQIIKINGQKINLQRFYSLCCDIIMKKQGDPKQQFTPTQFACLRKLFSTIFKANQTQKIKIQMPQNLIQDLNQNSSKFYQFLISFVLNGKFLTQASNQSLLKLYVYLYDILFFKKIEFRIAVQNRKLRIFSNIIKSIDSMQEQVRQKYSNLVTKLLLTHQTNPILLKKFSFLFYISHTTRSQYLQQLFENILFKMFTIYKGNQDTQLQHNKIIGRYFLTTYKNIQLIFVTGTPTIKMKILDSMIADQQLNIICHKMFNQLPNNELLQLNSWLIMNGKRNMFEFFDQQSQESLINLIFFLTQLSKLFLIETDLTHRQEIIAILHNFIKKSAKVLRDNDQQQIIQKLQNFYSLQPFVQIISEKISQYTCQQIKNRFTQNFINDYLNVLFQIMPKVVTIKALQQFRKCSQYSFVTCIYMLRLEDTHMLPQRNLSAFLQYLLEILFIMKHQQQSSSHLKEIAKQVKQYLQIITSNYAKQNKVCKVNQTFLYSLPKMFKRINFNDQNNVKKLVHTVKKTGVYEVHGGICFKLMCIAFHILQILPTEDHSNLLTFIIDKLSERYKLKYDPSYKMADPKAKSPIQNMFKQHEKYYQKFDQQIFVINAPIQRRLLNVMTQKQKQLTSYFLDFFFMKMFLYLQYSCWGDTNPQQIQVNKNYSKNILKLFRQYTQIYQQMNQKNAQSIIDFVCIDDLLKLIQDQGDLTVSDQMNSPNYSGRIISTEAFQTSKSQINPQFFNLNLQPIKSPRSPMGSPRSPRTPRSPRLIIKKSAFETKNKRKLQLLSKLQSNIFQWSQQGRQKQIHRYFRQQTKQIFFNELIHQLFIITSSIKTEKAVNISKGKRLIGFIQDIGNEFTLQDRNNDEDWKNIVQQIKKVQKFTCLSKPQIQLNPKLLPNLTHPFIRYAEPHNFTTLQKSFIKPPQKVTSQINSPVFNLNFTITLQEQQKKQSLDNLCQLSTIEGVYFGFWEMQNTSIKFTSKNKKQSSKPSQRFLKYGSPACNIIPRQNYQVVVQVQDILQIFYRKYNQIKNNSLQFFLRNGESVYFIMFTQYKAKIFIQRFKRKYQHSKSIKIVENFVKQFENQGYTQKWRIGQMSNFDYLMMVNKYSGRSKCDLNQYYIFPWILQDYTSEHLDISNSKIYRDLKKPIGALRKQKFQKYLQKFQNLSCYQDERYIYGSHYSTSLFIFYYLVRLQPFTTQHKDMQGGIFDSPDRLFSSIQQMWECLISQSSTSDIKESIPQFYYFPTFLKNINNLDLGMKQSGKSIGDVQLPNWAQSPADFIIKMRNCLESDYVSANLNYWIDLIFGKDQKSQEKYNIFHPLSYVENMNAQKIEFSNLDATMSQITFFGQNPYQLFSKQHPKKKIRMQSINLNPSPETPKTPKKQINQKQFLNNNFNLAYQQQNLPIIYYISSMQFQNKKSVKIKISSIEKESTTRSINLQMQNSLPSLIRSLQNIDNSSLKRMFSQKNLDPPEQKHYKACSKINQNQFQINIETKNKSQIIKKIKLPNKISGLCYNQIIFVTYGHDGLKVYDWNQQIIWHFSNQYGQITDCYLDINVIIFVTSQGKLFVYDFLGSYNQLVFQYTKQTYQAKMLVYAEPKQITKRNQNSYKILLVGDKRKIVVMHYTHQIGNKYQNN